MTVLYNFILCSGDFSDTYDGGNCKLSFDCTNVYVEKRNKIY